MAERTDKPFPPGDYPVVVVGSGPGGLQSSYFLRRPGDRARGHLGRPIAGGMFRRFPFFQRLLSWTKPHAPYPRATRDYEWYDWNSLLAVESREPRDHAGPDGRHLASSRHGPRWSSASQRSPSEPGLQRPLRRRLGSPRARDGERFVLQTSDGEYRCQVAIFAVGVAEPWMPDTPGFENVAHYVATRDPESYAGKRLFIIGKQNSRLRARNGTPPVGPAASCSPRPARRKLSVNTHSLPASGRATSSPVEDQILGGGVFMLNASINRIDRLGKAYRILATPFRGRGRAVGRCRRGDRGYRVRLPPHRIEMILWGQGVGPDKPRWIVIPFELLLQGPSLDSDQIRGSWLSGEHP